MKKNLYKEDSKKVVNISEGFKIYVSNSLEEYRAGTFFTKEPETIEWINSFIKNGDIFIDIGANIGIYSIYTALLYNYCKIYSFEPYLKNYIRLCDNIKLNNINNIFPFLLAISNKTSIDTFYIKDERIGASGSQVGSNIDEHGNYFDVLDKAVVQVYDVVSFLNIFNIDIPNHIKIDVDGIESKIIDGMSDLLSNEKLKSVLIEVNLNSSDFVILKKLFLKNDFIIDNKFNNLINHSRNRRKGTISQNAENIIFIKKGLF